MMVNEEIFRIIAIILFLSLLTIGLYHRIKAHNPQEKISRDEEGFTLMILLRFFGFSVWIGLIIYMINPDWMAWSSYPFSSGARWLGALIIFCALPFFYWMFRSLGTNVTDTVAIRKKHNLVTEGLYHWVRHPMYLLTILIVSGFSLLAANWFIAIMGFFTVRLLIVRTPIEEKKLIEKFGEEYHDYMKKTGKFIPKLH